MPAPTRRAASTRASLADRRRASLEGGSRGGLRCGWVSLQGYGNLKGRNRAELGDLADQADGDIALMPYRGFGDAGLFVEKQTKVVAWLHPKANLIANSSRLLPLQ